MTPSELMSVMVGGFATVYQALAAVSGLRAGRTKARESLPVKLVLPLGFFIFPVVLGVTLLPVVIKLFAALGITKGQ